jgi:hypothetical protein
VFPQVELLDAQVMHHYSNTQINLSKISQKYRILLKTSSSDFCVSEHALKTEEKWYLPGFTVDSVVFNSRDATNLCQFQEMQHFL